MIKKFNLPLLVIPCMLFSLGFVTLLSTSPSLIKNHLLYFLIGLIAYFIISFFDYEFYQYFWKYLIIIVIVLLFITVLFAEFRFGAARWLAVGSFTFQPSELAKLALIISLSSYLSSKKQEINNPSNLLMAACMILPVFLLVFLQPDLGTSLVIVLFSLGMLFFAGINKLYFLLLFIIGGIFSAPLWHFLKDYQKIRILVFLNPQLDVLGSGYNVIQSIIAIGSGGFLGKGFGRGTQSNLQFLPAYWTDFIFASFSEEWGFLGVLILISLFCLLLITILYIASKVDGDYAKLLCVGIFLMLFFQFTINVGMNLGIMPVTGVTLPLISYGGSSLIITMASLGIVQSVWRKNY